MFKLILVVPVLSLIVMVVGGSLGLLWIWLFRSAVLILTLFVGESPVCFSVIHGGCGADSIFVTEGLSKNVFIVSPVCVAFTVLPRRGSTVRR